MARESPRQERNTRCVAVCQTVGDRPIPVLKCGSHLFTGAELVADASLTRTFAACLPGPPLSGPLVALGAVSSTQHLALRLAATGAPEGTVVLADHQTAGHGRRGRRWFAPPGTALLFSVLLRPSLAPARWPELTLAAACAVADGIEAVTGAEPRLRWPNDVLVAGRKVSGVLADGIGGPEPCVIIGIGINVSRPPGGWPPEFASIAVALAEVGPPVGRETVLAAVLRRLAARYRELVRDGFGPVRDAWRRRGLLGATVTGPAGPGIADDLASDGGLVVRRPDGSRVTIVAGEVELLASPGPGDA